MEEPELLIAEDTDEEQPESDMDQLATIPDIKPMSMDEISSRMDSVKKFVQSQLREGVDYGRVSGVPKKFLWKSGAEKLLLLHGCTPTFTVIEKDENELRDGHPYFSYTMQCNVVHVASGRPIANAIGICDNRESRYWDRGSLKPKGDPHSQRNICIKMSQKRAMTSASLHIGALSAEFTMDEDLVGGATAGPVGAVPVAAGSSSESSAPIDPPEETAALSIQENIDSVRAVAQMKNPSHDEYADGIQTVCILMSKIEGKGTATEYLRRISDYKGRPTIKDLNNLRELVEFAGRDDKGAWKLKKNWEKAFDAFGSIERKAGDLARASEPTGDDEQDKRKLYKHLLSQIENKDAKTKLGENWTSHVQSGVEEVFNLKNIGEVTIDQLKRLSGDIDGFFETLVPIVADDQIPF